MRDFGEYLLPFKNFSKSFLFRFQQNFSEMPTGFSKTLICLRNFPYAKRVIFTHSRAHRRNPTHNYPSRIYPACRNPNTGN